MQLSIIIVNYNVKYFLEHCLLSVIKACDKISAEIIVVDNNSTDNSEQYLSSKFTSVQFIWNKENVGFGKANNQAIKIAKGDYILFLNPDTIIPENCFVNCLSFFENNKDAGAIGVRMIDGSGSFLKESKRNIPTAAAGFFKMFGLTTLFPSSTIFSKYYAGYLPEKENSAVEVLAGAFMMLSKKAIDSTKGFDENFFMYGEDIDLSYRIKKTGLQNYYVGTNTIIHFKGESTQKKSKNYTKLFYGAIELFVNKHYGKYAVKSMLMKTVIKIGKYVSIVKQSLSISLSQKKYKVKQQVLFIGNNDHLQTVNDIIRHSDFEIAEQKPNLSLPLEKNINAVLFCCNDFSTAQIIQWVQSLPKDKLALFYTSKAQSIIGSNDKNEKGIFISTY
jgi:GT2 family glycosyltransferase